MVFAAVPVFAPAASAFFLGIIPVWYTILCNINDVSGYYPFTVWGLALLGFYILLDVQPLHRQNDKFKAYKGRQREDEDVGGHGQPYRPL